MALPVIRAYIDAIDRRAVVALYRAAWHATYDAVDGPAAIDALVAALLEGEKPEMFDLLSGDVALVACQDGAIIGGIRAHPRADAVHLSGFYVAPGLQRHGAGTQLLSHLAALFPGSAIRADVRPTSAPALAFYRARGFIEIGSTRADVGGGHWVDVIELRRAAA